MPVGQHFDALMAQPGPSAAPAPAPQGAAGGIMSNNAIEQANMTNPIQQARIRTASSLEALKRVAADLAKERSDGFVP